jgi:hypothetical protein
MTKANDRSPTRRVLEGQDGEFYVVTLSGRTISVRPKGGRRHGPQDKTVTVGQLFLRLTLAELEAKKRARARARR